VGGCSDGNAVHPARPDAPLGLAQATRPPTPAAQRASAAHLVPDPEAAQSFAQSSSAHSVAGAPSTASAATTVAPGAPSDAEVRAELRQMHDAQRAATPPTASAAGGVASIDQQGNAQVPRHAPAAVARVIGGGNAIATFPYVFGGGHASFEDNAYDCSGSVGYALAAAGLVSAPLTSGELMSWGAPGPGRWITVLANAGHTYMYVAGLRFDTSGRAGPLGTRWQVAARSNDGFVARHWPGL
jgi:cell wall-associated NlpC family hydrolase